MRDVRRAVVGVDLTPEGEVTAGSRRALERAESLARVSGAHVTLVHSTRPDERWVPAENDFVAARPANAAGFDTLDALLSGLRAEGVETDLHVSAETPWLAVLHRVLREGADLVVVGKRSQEESDGRLLGSVATKLLRKAPCAVWVAKPRHLGPPRTILAASDRSAVGARAVAWGAELAREYGSALHVVHALTLPLSVQMAGSGAEADFLAQARAEAEAEIRGQLETAGLEKSEIHVGLTSPTRAVLECVERLEIDLVVMGTVSRGGVSGVLVGNTAERLLGRLDCSILAVKPDDFVCPVSLD